MYRWKRNGKAIWAVQLFFLPPLVVSRAKSVGAVGETWLANLDYVISELEKKWHISVGETLSGGTHAFVACADGEKGEKYALKIDMPENLGGEFSRGMTVLKMANGQGYSKLYLYDAKRKARLNLYCFTAMPMAGIHSKHYRAMDIS